MQTITDLGTFDDVLAPATEEVAAICVALRELIETLYPDAVEVPRTGDRAVSYGFGPKKMSEAYAYVMPQKGYANLGFYRGAGLPDPAGLLEGTGKALRHVKVRSLDDVGRAEVQQLLLEAMAERRSALGG